ncbi:response regulator [Sorangium sp. So ce429]
MSVEPMDNAKLRIILVDDEEALVWSLSNRLIKQRPGYTVESVTDGHAALRLFESGPVDLLITDICMQGMHGLELIMAARKRLPGLPVIVMTAYPTADLRQEVAQRGSIEYLEKPFEFDHFLRSVDEVLEGKRVGFSGAISVQTLPDIVQLYALSNATGVLRVRHRTGEGRIWFERGRIVHASTSTAVSVDAFYQVMLWNGGEFTMQLGLKAPDQTIHASWTELIMESCRLMDERRRTLESASGPASRAGWSLATMPGAGPQEGHSATGPPTMRVGAAPPASQSGDHLILDMMFDDETLSTKEDSMDVKQCLSRLDSIDGFVGAAIVDSESGMLLGQAGGGPINLEIAGASNTEVVRAKRKAIRNLNLKDEIEDILISLSKQYHLIRPLRSKQSLFFYVVLDRARANLAMARITLAEIERELTL